MIEYMCVLDAHQKMNAQLFKTNNFPFINLPNQTFLVDKQ